MSTDLENGLRAMLRTRADDIADAPDPIFAFEHHDASSADPDQRPTASPPQWWRRPQLVAVAAGVVAVLAVAGTVLAVRDGRFGNGPHPSLPATQPAPSPTSTTTVSTKRVRRTAALSSFDIGAGQGYTIDQRDSAPGYRSIALTLRGDPEPVQGASGGYPSTTFVYLYDAGRFDGTVVKGWRPARVDGRTAYLGRLGFIPVEGTAPVATVAMPIGGNRWVVVQGRTARSGTDAQLTALAGAVRPDRTVELVVPFRLGYAPLGSSVVSTSRVQTGPSMVTNLEFTAARVNFEISTYLSGKLTFGAAGQQPQRRDVGGLASTWYPHAGIAYTHLGEGTTARSAGRTVLITMTPPTGGAVLDRRQQAEFARLLDGIRWVNPRGGGLPAEQVIP